MKTYLPLVRWFLVLCTAMANAAFAQSLSWTQLPGAANDIGVGANGAVWVIGNSKSGNDFGIYRWNPGKNTWDAMPGGALRIDVDPQGNPWVVNSNRAIYRWAGSAWQMMPGLAYDVGIGANGAVWVIGTNQTGGGYGIYRWNAGKNNWDQMPGGAVRIDVDPQGNAWVVNNAGSIYRWTGSTWQQMPGAAKDVGIGANGAVWVVGTDGGVYQWDGSNWVKREGGLTDISVDAKGLPWGVNASKNIYTSAAVAASPPPPVATGPKSYLATGDVLTTGKFLVSDNRAFYVTMQGDGNLCVYKGSGPGDTVGGLWCNMVTAGGGAFYAVQQGDGNFCVYKGTPAASNGYHWCNMKTGGGGQFFTIVQNDGNLCTYRGTGPGDNKGYQWCSGATSVVSWSPPNPAISALQPSGAAKTVRAGIPGYDVNFPKNVPCPTDTYTVPAGISYVKITAVGGAGVGGDSTNVVNNIVGIAGFVGGKDLSAPSSMTSWSDITGGSGGRGASVDAVFKVTPGQTLYLVAGMPGQIGMKSSRGIYSSGFPGGGYGFHPGGGYSMVTTVRPVRVQDPNVCSVDKGAILVIAGGGGGGGLPAGAGFGGSGGDAGMLNASANGGGDGGGWRSGGGGGGGSQTAGGGVGSHPGCGSELRANGGYLWGSMNGGYGGAGGGGLYGGGGGGGGDCFFNTGHAGGGGGSSYVAPGAQNARSVVDTANDAKVVIQALK